MINTWNILLSTICSSSLLSSIIFFSTVVLTLRSCEILVVQTVNGWGTLQRAPISPNISPVDSTP